MKKKSAKLLDAFAVLCWMQQEPGWQRVKGLLDKAENGEERLIMGQVNAAKVYYQAIRVLGLESARKVLEAVQLLSVRIIPASEQLVMRAAEIKAAHPISLADCVAAATAESEDAAIATGDREFALLEELVAIEWLE